VRAWPQSVGLPATMTEELDAGLKKAVESGATSGVEAMALVGNRIVYHKAFGFAQKTPKQIPLRKDSLYDLASLTKVVVTTTSLMILVDRGDIDLDFPVKTYIPEFDGDGREDVTVRHLLTHTSGLGNLGRINLTHSGKQEYLEVIRQVKLHHTPGEDRIYSDLGMILAGFVVERVSGQPLDRFAEENVFRPLGMTHTFFNPPLAKRWRCAATELCKWRERVMQGEVHDENAFAMGGVAGHAGLFSRAKDLAVFCRMMLNHGTYNSKQILKEATVAKMLEPQPIPGYDRQALGWHLQEERGQKTGFLLSEKTYGHTGFTGTSIRIDPENDAVAILLGNAVHPRREGARREEYRVPFHEVFTNALEGL
jgi:serine-type D-Ala-D-Ala carboxypeptidase